MTKYLIIAYSIMKCIHLLSGPRNISTALMYAFAQRSACKVIDEPFYGYYLTATGKQHPGREEVLSTMITGPEEIMDDIELRMEEEGELFLKNMPHHVEGLDLKRLSSCTTIFLIRHPSLMIRSFTKVIPDISLHDLALPLQVERYHEMALSQEPIVIDSSRVLKDPESGLRKLCEAIEIPFEDSMLQWTPGPIGEDGIWAKYWYANVHASSGWTARIESSVAVEEKYADLYDEAMEHYQFLFDRKLF